MALHFAMDWQNDPVMSSVISASTTVCTCTFVLTHVMQRNSVTIWPSLAGNKENASVCPSASSTATVSTILPSPSPSLVPSPTGITLFVITL